MLLACENRVFTKDVNISYIQVFLSSALLFLTQHFGKFVEFFISEICHLTAAVNLQE